MLASCSKTGDRISTDHRLSDEFKDYWYNGKAELSSYSLTQARYGQLHDGLAHLIFVTEDFSLKRHVKIDSKKGSPQQISSVLKLNALRNFQTGIYDYRLMQSVFTPLEEKEYHFPLKTNLSSQDWCGQWYFQMNKDGRKYRTELRSYFGSEGDISSHIPLAIPEDGIWNLIRISPEILPLGKVMMIPGSVFLRLRHTRAKAFEAECAITASGENMEYTISYPALAYSLSVRFHKAFPHQIEGWTESYVSGSGDEAEIMETTARRINTLQIDYWNRNRNGEEALREVLDNTPGTIRQSEHD